MTHVPTVYWPLTRRAAAQLRRCVVSQGFVRVRAALAPDAIATLTAAVATLIHQPPGDRGLTWESQSTAGGTVVQRITRVNCFSPAIARVAAESPIIRELGALALGGYASRVCIADGSEGSDGIVLVVKDPRNASIHRHLRWHRDCDFTRHLELNPFVNCGIYLDRSDSKRGAVLVLPRWHSHQFATDFNETTQRLRGEICIPAAPGDVVIHRSDLWHRSGPHCVPGGQRRVLYANVYCR